MVRSQTDTQNFDPQNLQLCSLNKFNTVKEKDKKKKKRRKIIYLKRMKNYFREIIKIKTSITRKNLIETDEKYKTNYKINL